MLGDDFGEEIFDVLKPISGADEGSTFEYRRSVSLEKPLQLPI